MQTIQEIEVWYILPAIRRELAKSMLKKGMKQKEIAMLLGITKPAVSQYLKSKRAKEVEFDKDMLDEVNASVNNINNIAGNIGNIGNIAGTGSCVMKEIQRLCSFARKKGIVCEIHRKKDNMQCRCNACIE